MPFYSNQDTKKSFYNKNSTSEMIIDIFNLTRDLSCSLIKYAPFNAFEIVPLVCIKLDLEVIILVGYF